MAGYLSSPRFHEGVRFVRRGAVGYGSSRARGWLVLFATRFHGLLAILQVEQTRVDIRQKTILTLAANSPRVAGLHHAVALRHQ